MPTLLELTAMIVSAHVSNKQMSSDEMIQELQTVFASLKALEDGTAANVSQPEPPKQITIKQAFKKDEVICLICGKGFKTLKRHLNQAHGLKPGQYRKQFNIPSTQSLAAKSYVESRRQMAIDKGLGEGLVKARAVRASAVKAKAGVPAKTVKAPVPAVKEKTGVPAKRAKTPVPAVKRKVAVPAKAKKK